MSATLILAVLVLTLAGPPLGVARETAPQESPVAIDFESLPDGTPACASCPLTDQYAEFGIVFSFRSWQAEETHAQLIESTSYDPPEVSPNHGVTAALTASGFHPGVFTLEFSKAPAEVELTIRGSNVVDQFAVAAFDQDDNRLPLSVIRRIDERDYAAAGGGGFREERVAVTFHPGIGRMELDGYGPPGHILLIDDVRLSLLAGVSARLRPPR